MTCASWILPNEMMTRKSSGMTATLLNVTGTSPDGRRFLAQCSIKSRFKMHMIDSRYTHPTKRNFSPGRGTRLVWM